MERGISDKNILDKFAEDFAKVVEKHVKYIIVSGFVAIAHGMGRSTIDIDMIIEKMEKNEFVDMHNDLIKAGFECMQSHDGKIIYDD